MSQIDHNFRKIFGVSDSLTSKWNQFIETNLVTIKAMINNPIVIQSLNMLDVEEGKVKFVSFR